MEHSEEKISKEEIERGIEFIKNEFPFFNEKKLYLDEGDKVNIEYPGDAFGLDFCEFDYLTSELAKFKIINNGRFHTTWYSYQIIRFDNEEIQYNLLNKTDFATKFELGEIRIDEDIDILRFVAIKLGQYDEEFGTFHHHYPVVEIRYYDKRDRLSVESETELIMSYLFEISDSKGYNISLDKFKIPDIELETKIEEITDNKEKEIIKLKPLIKFNEAMGLYISALQVNDNSLKFLNFYKIIEYFGPIIIRLEGNKLLVSKLDNPKSLNPDRKYIDSIFDLVNSVKENQRDSELGKSVLKHIDIIDSISLLPERIIKESMTVAKIKDINYDTPKDKLLIVINKISTALYNTRNWVVHAKSNYTLTGKEFKIDELEQLNYFMKHITAKLIRWYDKLPNHQK